MSAPRADAPAGAPWRAALPIALATASGAAAAELLIVGLRRFVLGHMVFTGWQTLWTTPASYALLLAPVGAVLAAAARLRPSIVSAGVVVFVPVWLAAFSIAFLFSPPLHGFAALILSAGVAVALTRGIVPRLDRAARNGRRVGAVAGALIVLIAIVAHGGTALAERRARAALPPAVPGAPSVLLLVLDAVRARNLPAYGYARGATPALDRLAAHGVTFLHAYATAPWTLPSHASLFTGRYPRELTAGWQTPLQHDVPTLAGIMAARGYATAGFVGNVAYCGRETGLARGFGHYEDYTITAGELVEASSLGRIIANNPRLRALAGYHDIPGRRTAHDIADAFLRWHRQSGERPFFAFLNFYDAHEPYLPPTAGGAAAPRRLDLIRMLNARMAERAFKRAMPLAERRNEEAAYDGGITAIDAEIGRLLDTLERRGQPTIVIVVGDHGEQFGEHDLFSHGNSLYLPLLHVPLLVSRAGRQDDGARVAQPVTLRDLPATLLALTGAAPALPGHSLLDTAFRPLGSPSPILADLRPAPNGERSYPAARGPMLAVLDELRHYIRNGDGREELFELTDTAQAFNLAARPGADSLLRAYRAAAATVR